MHVRVLVLCALAIAAEASAEPKPYRGAHPIDLEGRWHYESSAHVHDDLPVGRAPFADIDGVLVFLGDPRAYGYDGEVWTFRGAHPLPPAMNGDCGILGEHAHPFAPEGSFRREASGAYSFTGAFVGGRHSYVPGSTAPPAAITRPSAPTPVVVGAPIQAFVNVRPGVYTSVVVNPRSREEGAAPPVPPVPPPAPEARAPEPARAVAPGSFRRHPRR